MKRTLLFICLVSILVNTAVAQHPFNFNIDTEAGDLSLNVLGHASVKMEWDDRVIYIDPYSKVADFNVLPKADIILITHEHSDHFDTNAINAIKTDSTIIIYTSSCKAATTYTGQDLVMSNGDSIVTDGLLIKAVPAYNIVRPRHVKGIGNGYLIWFGSKQIYLAGDTEIIPEMDAIKEVTAAFLGFSKYNMDEEMFVEAIEKMKPAFVVPYHYDDSDITSLLQTSSNIEGVSILTSNNTDRHKSAIVPELFFCPNPAKQYLYPSNSINKNNFNCYNSNGKIVNSLVIWKEDYIDIQNLQEGIYFLEGKESYAGYIYRFLVK